MLKRMTLINVRRHAHTELDFDGDAQLVALAGVNGAGKSTVLEAILYALYGETRHGKSGLASMVRRGYEHEGMQVTLEFVVSDVPYEVTRRWEKGKSTASLKASGVETMRSVAEVNAEISRILGLDPTGFKLATIAKQKELDGLADLTPGKRKAAVSKLLRLDAIADAAKSARSEYAKHRQVAEELSRYSDVSTLEVAFKQAQSDLREAEEALAKQRTTVADLDEQLMAGRSVKMQWQETLDQVNREQARVDELSSQLESAQSQVDSLTIPEEPTTPARPRAQVEAEQAELLKKVAEAEAANAVQVQRAAVEEELETTLNLMGPLKSTADSVSVWEAEEATLRKTEEALKDAVTQALQKQDESHYQVLSLQAQHHAAVERLDQVTQLSNSCPTCEQTVEPDLHSELVTKQQDNVAALATQEMAARGDLDDRKSAVERAEGDLREVQSELTLVQSKLADGRSCARELEKMARAVATYESTLSRLGGAGVDIEPLYARQRELEQERKEVAKAEEQAAERARVTALLDQLKARVDELSTRLVQAQEALAQCQPGENLRKQMSELEAIQRQQDQEVEILGILNQQQATCAAQEAAARVAYEASLSAKEKLDSHRRQAETASKSATVLAELGRSLAAEARPNFEAELSTLLNALSEGRFTRVSVNEEYEVNVEDDDGKFHPVSEFSGGESDLIALAVRLALAQVVARRNGAENPGFLILDEVLGSQDEGRRLAILEGLRRLRGVYGQILLISHVGGLEDTADRVIRVSVDDGVSEAA